MDISKVPIGARFTRMLVQMAICVSGLSSAVIAQQSVIDPSAIEETLGTGENAAHTLTLSNTGEAHLSYTLSINQTSGPSAGERAANIPDGVEYAPGELIIKMAKGAVSAAVVSLRESVNATVKKTIEQLNIEVWTLPINDDAHLLNLMGELSADPNIEYAEPNYIQKAIGIPNDSRFDELWGMHNTGQSGGTADADIDAVEAWDTFTGSHDVVVAVIDTGVDYNHIDLVDNRWINVGEIAGNGVDDDGNGFVDDVYGYDFAYNDGDPMDAYSHGTHCSGTIGGVGNNGIGVAGVSHAVRIMAVKFLDDNGSGSTDDAIEAIIYAIDNGAQILSNSWGGGGFSQSIEDAINYANDHNVLFVAAAGNSNNDNDVNPFYPSSYEVPNVLAVASTDHNDAKASSSSYGLTSVDLGAPGVSILSTVPGNSYAYKSGTSMATPHVSGAAALLKGYNPNLSALELKSIIMDSVDPVASMNGITVTGGRLNINNAMMMAKTPWITLEGELSGEIPPGGSVEVTVLLNTTELTLGDYTADINVDTNDPVNPHQVVPVVLHVIAETRYSLEVAKSGTGDGTVTSSPAGIECGSDCLEDYLAGTSVLLTATPASGSSFSGWTNCPTPTDNECTVVMEQSRQVTAMIDLILPPVLRVEPTEMPPVTLRQDEAPTTEILTLHNDGDGELRFDLRTEENTLAGNYETIPYMEIGKGEEDPRQGLAEGQGGPDVFGYRWIDSDEAGGPTFDWIDISGTGTLITGLTDDNPVGPFPIGFNFDFYGNAHTEFYVQSNGLINFNEQSITFSNQSIPVADGYNNLIAWMWDDLYPDSDSQVYYEVVDGNKLVIQFQNYGEYNSAGRVDAQVILYRNGNIRIQYLEFRNSMDLEGSTIGIENLDGTDGLQVAFNVSYLHNELAILFTHGASWLRPALISGTIPAGGSQDISLIYDAKNKAVGDYAADIIIASNDPVNPEVTVPATLRVEPQLPGVMVSSPISIEETLGEGEGESSAHTLTLNNTGEGSLSYNLSVSQTSGHTAAPSERAVLTDIPEGVEYAPGELIIKLAKGAVSAAVVSLRESVNATVKKTIEPLDLEVWHLPVTDEADLLKIIWKLSADSNIEYAEPNYIQKAIGIPNDTRFDELWGMHNTGQSGGTADADIDAVEAWDTFTGSHDVVVAVIDTGVDYNHIDLVDNRWINVSEIAGNGVDDDGNGYIDDVYGYDFAYNDGDPMDAYSHGTHCSGTIGGVGNNGIGVAGVSHAVRIMAVKFLNDSGSGSTDDAIDAIIYAVDNGAQILSNSWGGGGFSQGLEDAISYANAHNVLFVAAAGNSDNDNDVNPFYPSSHDVPNVLAVAATDHNDAKASFSSYGLTSVDLGAPGVSILSTVPGNGYDSFNGTSMATPHVSGAAALLKGYNPNLSALELKSIIMDNVEPVASMNGITVTGGRLNINNALMMAGTPWITLEGELSGEIPPGGSVEVTVLLNTTELTLGDYTADINVDSNDPVNPHQVVPVVLHVSEINEPSRPNDLVIDFGSESGIWAWMNNDSWADIHPLSPISMVIGDIDDSGQDDLIADFSPDGIWILMNYDTWVFLHSLSAESMTTGDMDGNGLAEVIIDFGEQIGIWVWMNNSSWVQLHSLSPESLTTGDVDGGGLADIIIDFGSSDGIWVRMNNSSWTQLHSLSAESITTGDMDGNGLDDVIIDFGSSDGIWVRMNNSSWTQLHSLSAESMTTGDMDGDGMDDVVIDFGSPYGIWVMMNNSSWVKLHSLSANSMTTGYLDNNAQADVIIDFGEPIGIWVMMNNSSWVKLHSISGEGMVTGNIDGLPSVSNTDITTHEVPAELDNAEPLPEAEFMSLN